MAIEPPNPAVGIPIIRAHSEAGTRDPQCILLDDAASSRLLEERKQPLPPPDPSSLMGRAVRLFGPRFQHACERLASLLRRLSALRRLLWRKFLGWCAKSGENGAVLSNGKVLMIVTVQLFMWINMGAVSKFGVRALGLPAGKRRPDVSSWRCRLIGWLVENGAVLTLCNLRSLLPLPKPIPAEVPEGCTLQRATAQGMLCIWRNMLISIGSNLIAEQGSVLLLHLTSTRLYPQVNPFLEMYSDVTPYTARALLDWLRGNGILQIVGGGIALGSIESFLPVPAGSELDVTEFGIKNFLGHFGVFRILVDIVFYANHRMLHWSPWLYKNVHKRHHEHFTTNLSTVFHFNPLDLFLESAMPIFSALAFMRSGLGIKMSRYEVHLMMTYVAWHEAGTHLGKPLPVISAYPPLSFVYGLFTGNKSTAIEFHEVHHNKRHCNYGITQWIDRLMLSHVLKACT
eukprot:TRINITY_DN10648_c0_g2_i1.p1 TRINITY_DN10648_c0_g2~~TRINITY_DN10648_c0_g2_i1.p1  ORF type:complete len:457 (-),score=115.83 TRINITY_DN10648_c0_g2_i1:290-1660(-)